MINLEEYSYSIRNSYISITKVEDQLLFRNVGNGDEDLCTLFNIDLTKNQITKLEAKIGHLVLYNNTHQCKINFGSTESLIFDSEFDLKLDFSPSKYEFASKVANDILTINLYSKRSKLLLVSSDEIRMTQNWNIISSENLDVMVKPGASKISLSNNNFTEDQFIVKNVEDWNSKDIENDFLKFWNLEKIDYRSKLFESQYILWSGFVHAKGNLKYDACYMSMNIMTNIWSWDNCFVSLGLAKEQPQRAFEQFISFEHVQSEEGNYPDFMNPDFVSYDFTKPPVQGVLYLELLQMNPQFFGEKSRLSSIYQSMKKLLSYWIEYRTFNGLYELPFNTHGNDTGLDNATIFGNTVTVRSPDLMVYLLKLIDLLSYIESKLDMDLYDYSNVSQLLIDELCVTMFREDKYISYDVFTGEVNPDSKCIIELIPLLVFDKLPSNQQQALLTNVSQFLTEFGLASEAPSSKYYREDGYWRGPIWAPTTCLCYIGLKESDLQIANKVKNQYIEMCEKYGFAENFNALTGEGLSDKAFAWTAAVYKFLKEKNE